MASLSLKAAARESGVAKTTLLRSIRDGRLSAQKDDKGSWSIQPAELFRAFPRSADPPGQGSEPGSVVQNGPAADPPSIEVWTRLARAEARLEALEQVNRDLREERDRWASMAEQTQRLLMAPKPTGPWWWPWARG